MRLRETIVSLLAAFAVAIAWPAAPCAGAEAHRQGDRAGHGSHGDAPGPRALADALCLQACPAIAGASGTEVPRPACPVPSSAPRFGFADGDGDGIDCGPEPPPPR